MSAPPRPLPWRIRVVHLIAADGVETVAADCPVTEHAERAVNAFDALLAVAKEAADHEEGPGIQDQRMERALDALTQAHPGWRDWGTNPGTKADTGDDGPDT